MRRCVPAGVRPGLVPSGEGGEAGEAFSAAPARVNVIFLDLHSRKIGRARVSGLKKLPHLPLPPLTHHHPEHRDKLWITALIYCTYRVKYVYWCVCAPPLKDCPGFRFP